MVSDRQIPDVDPDDDELAAPAHVIRVPATISAIVPCPTCGETVTISAALAARVVRDSDGRGSLALRTRAAKIDHVCGQLPLGLVEGSRSR